MQFARRDVQSRIMRQANAWYRLLQGRSPSMKPMCEQSWQGLVNAGRNVLMVGSIEEPMLSVSLESSAGLLCQERELIQ
jgi:hypothetical protein